MWCLFPLQVSHSHLEGDLAGLPEDTLVAGHPKAVHQVLRQPEGHHLGRLQDQALCFKAAMTNEINGAMCTHYVGLWLLQTALHNVASF